MGRSTSLPDDVERNAAETAVRASADPFSLRAGLKDEPELAAMRSRHRGGKKLEKYHKIQNEVGLKKRIHDSLST